MTKPLQEMLHQMSMVVANLVALSERIKQLQELNFIESHSDKLKQLSGHVIHFLEQKIRCLMKIFCSYLTSLKMIS